MSQKFVKYQPVVYRGDREKIIFLGVIGAFFSIIAIVIFVLNSRPDASANEDLARNTNAMPAAIGTVVLLAPETEVPSGTRLADVPLREVYWPRNQVPEGAIREVSDVKALYAKTRLPAGLPLIRDNLTADQFQGSLRLAKGHRAVTIELDATGSLEGHALPGTRVDVVLTYLKGGQRTSKVIVQNASVVSFGGMTKGNFNQGTGVQPRSDVTITLDVIARDALKIQTAKSMGLLSLQMRPQDETTSSGMTEFDQNDMEGDDSKKFVPKGAFCSKGRVKIEGKEFVVGCDGKISQVMDNQEP